MSANGANKLVPVTGPYGVSEPNAELLSHDLERDLSLKAVIWQTAIAPNRYHVGVEAPPADYAHIAGLVGHWLRKG